MPKTRVIFYREEADGSVPLLDWLDEIPARARIKCLVKIERLAAEGHELRRPEADLLRDDIYELRIGLQGINYRVLYFFHGRVAAVLSHGLVKERRVSPREIEVAIRRMEKFKTAPEAHTFEETE